MKRRAWPVIIIMLGAVICLRCTPQEKPSTETLQELRTLYRARNYFALQARLQRMPDAASPVILYYEAAAERAFNRPEASNRRLDQLLETDGIPDSLLADCWTMKMENFLRLHAYADALHAADEVLQIRDLPEEKENDVRNTRIIVSALKGIPPQSVEKHGDSKLLLKGTHIDVTIHGRQRDYAYDTGANYSILMASEARELDLHVIEAGFDVGTATGQIVKGDLGIADSLAIGNITLRHVVFLVFPDETLTFPGGFQLRGVIGFPVLEALGELQFQNGTIFVPQNPPARDIHNLALENLTPLIQFTCRGDRLIGRFDTGADKTDFYQPFFRRYFANTVTPAQIDTVKSGSVGGIVEHPVYRLNTITIGLADTSVTLDSVNIHTEVLGDSSENYLYANIGLDVLRNFNRYILNFRDMALILQ